MPKRSRQRRRKHVSVGDLSFFSFQDIITSVTGILLLVTLIMAASIVKKPVEAFTSPKKSEVTAYRDDPAAEAAAQQKISQDRHDAISLASETLELKNGLTVEKILVASAGNGVSGNEVDRLISELPALHDKAAPELKAAHDEVVRLDTQITDARSKIEQANQLAVMTAAAIKANADDMTFLPGRQQAKPILVELDTDETRVGDLSPDGHARLLATAKSGSDASAIQDALASFDKSNVTIVILARPGGVARVKDVIDDIKHRGISVGWDVAPARAVFAVTDKGDAHGTTPQP